MPFYCITTLLSGTSYNTFNLYFGHIWKIQCLLKVNRSNEDSIIREMISKMRIKFDKYWEQYSVILALGAVLDPRMKFRLLKRCYDDLDPFTSKEKIKHLKDKLYKLFEEYRKKYSLTPVVSSTRVDSRVAKRGRGNLDVQDVISKYRSRLLPSNVQALLCTRSWIHGYLLDDEDNGECEMVII